MRKFTTGLLNALCLQDCFLISFFISAVLLSGCTAGKSSFSAARKYSPAELKKDFTVFQNILEESHPGLYWYTPKDSMDAYFRTGRELLTDSMSESEFRKVLSYVTARIRCGHTAIRPSRRNQSSADSLRAFVFPLSLKIWDDTVVVVANLHRNDTLLKRGTVITAINGRPVSRIVDSLSQFISADGYNMTHKWQTLSNRGGFGSLYTAVYGPSSRYEISFMDDNHSERSILLPAYRPRTDTAARLAARLSSSERKKQNLASARSLKMDTLAGVAIMNLNTFSRGARLRRFLRSSFRSFSKQQTGYLIIDLRSNGGGSVTNSTLLTRYISDTPFKVADSLYALRRKSRYGRYIKNHFFNQVFMYVFTRQKADGHFHFGYFERHHFRPKKKHHFGGRVYILTGGNSFSASTLFIHSVMRQDNVTVVGEETGGGAYGNSAWLIPDVTLPNTGVRFRLPLFRLVINKNIPQDGRGILPHVESKPTVEDIRLGKDFKLDKALDLIRQEMKKNTPPSTPPR